MNYMYNAEAVKPGVMAGFGIITIITIISFAVPIYMAYQLRKIRTAVER